MQTRTLPVEPHRGTTSPLLVMPPPVQNQPASKIAYQLADAIAKFEEYAERAWITVFEELQPLLPGLDDLVLDIDDLVQRLPLRVPPA